ncbi:hypothetical protein Bbelb_005400 [Branchiostoma belcheri]|nr:hypothetical protein Bbelb_005400 [Branchiostoma belcheri]
MDLGHLQADPLVGRNRSEHVLHVPPSVTTKEGHAHLSTRSAGIASFAVRRRPVVYSCTAVWLQDWTHGSVERTLPLRLVYLDPDCDPNKRLITGRPGNSKGTKTSPWQQMGAVTMTTERSQCRDYMTAD